MAFTAEHFNSGDGMITTVWGPPLWHTLHTISFNYPTHPDRATRKQYYRFLRSLEHVLPCGHCRNNYGHNLHDLGFSKAHLRSRATFSRFIFDLHEHVNAMLGKPPSGLTYDRVRERYENFRSRCVNTADDALVTAPATADAADAGPTERGCTEPLYGKKSKCIMRIVPKESARRTFAMDRQCCLRRSVVLPSAAQSPRSYMSKGKGGGGS